MNEVGRDEPPSVRFFQRLRERDSRGSGAWTEDHELAVHEHIYSLWILASPERQGEELVECIRRLYCVLGVPMPDDVFLYGEALVKRTEILVKLGMVPPEALVRLRDSVGKGK